MKFPQVIEYTKNGTKFRAEYDKEYDDGKCFYLVYHWYENESVGPFKQSQDLGCWLVYCHQTFEGIMEIMNKEKTKMKQLKPFNLEQALAGAPVVTRNGLPIVEIQYLQTSGQVAAVRQEKDEKLITYLIPTGGRHSDKYEYVSDLFMDPIKKEGWINLYPSYVADSVVCSSCVHHSQQEAKDKAEIGVIATVKIEWEE